MTIRPVRQIAVAALAAAAACAALASPAGAVIPGQSGPIAFPGLVEGNRQVFVVNPDGRFLSQVTDDPQGAGHVVWFPDGRRLAYLTLRSSELKVLDIQTGNVRRATASDFIDASMFSQAEAPVWSPDGRRLAYTSGLGASARVLVATRGAGAPVDVTGASGFGFGPDWSPDGTRVAFGGSTGVWVANADGSGTTQLTSSPTQYGQPSWSPDGARIAMVAFGPSPTTSQIYVGNSDGSSVTPVGAPGELGNPTWSPDGSRIAFVRGFGAGARLWTMRPDGADASRLLGSRGPDRGSQIMSWSSGPPLSGPVLPPPDRRAVNASVVSGTVLVRRRGSRRFRRLEAGARIPYGSVLDTRRGKVRIVAAARRRKTASAVFNAGRFVLARRAGAVTELRLTGPLAGCGRASARDAAAVAARRKKGRRLWGSGKGRFRTRGRRSAATVTGTRWLVEDRCDGSTLTRVARGVVKVRDFKRRRTVTVRAGGRYVARP
jgi:hypothetical protein